MGESKKTVRVQTRIKTRIGVSVRRIKIVDEIISPDGLTPGQAVAIPSLIGGFSIAFVHRDGDRWWAENETFYYPLEFSSLDGWLAKSVISKKAVENVRFEKDESRLQGSGNVPQMG